MRSRVSGGWLVGGLVLALSSVLVACDSGPALTPAPSAAPTTASQLPPTIAAPLPTPFPTPTDLDAILTVIPEDITATPAAPQADLSDQQKIAVYTLVITDLLKKDKSKQVYISPYVGQGERLDDPNEDLPLPTTLDDTLHAQDPKREYQLSTFADAVGPLEDGGKVKNSGAFLTLGAITSDTTSHGAVTVRASIYRGVGDGTGNDYRLERSGTAWKITSVTQDWNDQP